MSIQEYGRLRWSMEENVPAYMKLDVSSVVKDHKDRHAALLHVYIRGILQYGTRGEDFSVTVKVPISILPSAGPRHAASKVDPHPACLMPTSDEGLCTCAS